MSGHSSKGAGSSSHRKLHGDDPLPQEHLGDPPTSQGPQCSESLGLLPHLLPWALGFVLQRPMVPSNLNYLLKGSASSYGHIGGQGFHM